MSSAPEPPELHGETATDSPAAEPAPVVLADALFGGRREVVILHDAVRYRLRITRKNKLILQK